MVPVNHGGNAKALLLATVRPVLSGHYSVTLSDQAEQPYDANVTITWRKLRPLPIDYDLVIPSVIF